MLILAVWRKPNAKERGEEEEEELGPSSWRSG